jgi:methionyl-tRNA synthetase
VTTLALRHPELDLRRGKAAESDADQRLADAAARAARDTGEAVDDFALHQALAATLELAAAANRYADEQEPWLLSKRATTLPSGEARDDVLHQLAHVLWRLLEALRVTAVLLAPFLPEAAHGIARRAGFDARDLGDFTAASFGGARRFRPQPGPPLFPRLEGRYGAAPGPVLASS